RWRELVGAFAWAAAPLVPFVFMMLLYNWVRWGALLNFGYDTKGATTGERTLWGLWGLLFSPGKSVLLYSPPLLLSLWALPRLSHGMSSLLWLLVATVGPVLLLNAGLLYWSGDYAWGPRYLVFAVPALLVPGALVIEDALARAPGWRRRAALAGVGATLAAG